MGNNDNATIERKDLVDLLESLEDEINAEISRADSESSIHSASEYYRSDMKGFARGLYQARQKIITGIREKLLGEK
ncbi:hypothetical protein ACFL6N_02855 [Thermodesulfobacteriota bacterium]